MTRKNLQDITLKTPKVKEPTKSTNVFKTAETIEVKTQYSKKDILDLEHLNFAAGITLGNMLVLVLRKKVMRFTNVT